MDYTQMQRELFRLKKEYPTLCVQIFGQSTLGRRLYAVQTGRGPNSVLFAGAFHGMEHITAGLLLRFAEDLCREGRVPRCRLVLAPMINPDGVEIQQHGWRRAGCYGSLVKRLTGGDTGRWQANGRGVDLNHNFDAEWSDLRRREKAAGIAGPAATRFGGYYPESERESHALATFCRNEQFSMAVAFHTQGEEIYWEFGENTPAVSYDIANCMARVSGYAVSSPEGLASGGGFKDWFIAVCRRPGFTVEAGRGQNPLPESDLPQIYQHLRPLMEQALACCCTLER